MKILQLQHNLALLKTQITKQKYVGFCCWIVVTVNELVYIHTISSRGKVKNQRNEKLAKARNEKTEK